MSPNSDESHAPALQPTWPIAYAILLVLVFLVFHPILLHDYGSSDDYSNFANIRLEVDPELTHWNSLGRPLSAFFYRALTERLDTFSDVTALRFAYLLLLSLSALSIFAVARKTGHGPWTALAISSLCTLSPAIVDLGSFTTEYSDPLGIVAVAAGFHAWWSSLEEPLSPGRRVAMVLVAIVCLNIALTLYQITAFMWIFFLGMATLTPRSFSWPAVRRIAQGLGLLVLALIAYRLLVMELYVRWAGFVPTDRAEISSMLPFKIIWFFAMPLRDALHLFVVLPHDLMLDSMGMLLTRRAAFLPELLGMALTDPSYWLSAATGLLILGGLWLHFEGERRMRLVGLLAAFTLLPASYVLNIVISSLWSPYRTQLALYCLVCLYLVLAVRAICGRLAPGRPLAATVVLVVLVELAAISIYWVNRAYVVEPLRCEWETLLSSVGSADAERLLVVPVASERDTPAPGLRYELGRLAGAAPWAPRSMVLLARLELGMPPPAELLVSKDTNVPATLLPGTAVIHLGCRR